MTDPNYREIKTSTKPKAISINEAAELANVTVTIINNCINRQKLNYGFALDKRSKKPADENRKGQKLVIVDATWRNYLRARKK